MRRTLTTAVAAVFALSLTLSPATWAQSSAGTSGGTTGTGGNAASTAGASNPAGVNGGLGNAGVPQQTPGTNSLGTANSGGGATVGHSSPDRPGSLDVTDPLQKEVDKKMNGICRGC